MQAPTPTLTLTLPFPQIRINKWGILSIQYLVDVEEGQQPVFIEFLVSSLH